MGEGDVGRLLPSRASAREAAGCAAPAGQYDPSSAPCPAAPAFTFSSAPRIGPSTAPGTGGPGPGAYEAAAAFLASDRAPRAPAPQLRVPCGGGGEPASAATPGPGQYEVAAAAARVAEWGGAGGFRFGTEERGGAVGLGPDGPGPGAYDAAGGAGAGHVSTPHLGPGPATDGFAAGACDDRAAWAAPRAGPGPGEYDPGPGPQHRVPLGLIFPPPERDAGGGAGLPGPLAAARDGPGPGAYDPASPVSAGGGDTRSETGGGPGGRGES